ncbi:MAG: hypothetical protein VR78_17870 [Hoeflea sp. BRH_c9]|nr:MAG: hypothetical protein VR78_17870 [Hoeflea sp. BRH_c9]
MSFDFLVSNLNLMLKGFRFVFSFCGNSEWIKPPTHFFRDLQLLEFVPPFISQRLQFGILVSQFLALLSQF